MKLALSQEEESQRTVHGGHVRQGLLPACRRGTRGGSDSGTDASGAPRRCYPVSPCRGLQQNLNGMRRIKLTALIKSFDEALPQDTQQDLSSAKDEDS
jgi:hypothetical protein